MKKFFEALRLRFTKLPPFDQQEPPCFLDLVSAERVNEAVGEKTTHKKLTRVRRPRTSLQIEVPMPKGETLQRSLPIVLGVMGDFSGMPANPECRFISRSFVAINRENFDDVLEKTLGKVCIQVAETSANEPAKSITLTFKSLEDFSPQSILKQVPSARGLLSERCTLTKAVKEAKTTQDDTAVSRHTLRLVSVDRELTSLVESILHHPRLSEIEGRWRGLHYLVSNSETGTNLKIRVISLTKSELRRDMLRSSFYTHSLLFKKVVGDPLGSLEREPFTAIMGDYEFGVADDDIEVLSEVSKVAAYASCPFFAAASPSLCGLNAWSDLHEPHDIERLLEAPEYERWNTYRDSDASRFVALTLPRVLARAPYVPSEPLLEDFEFDEMGSKSLGDIETPETDSYCWMNSSFMLAQCFLNSCAMYGLGTAIRGADNGGRVTDLPRRKYRYADGYGDACSTDIAIDSDRWEKELSDAGLLPLVDYRYGNYCVFFSGSTTHRPRRNDRPEATGDEAIFSRLPCVIACSHFLQYLRFAAHLEFEAGRKPHEVEQSLNHWLLNYVAADPESSAAVTKRLPLLDGRVEISALADGQGQRRVRVYLRPNLWIEELKDPVRLSFLYHGGDQSSR